MAVQTTSDDSVLDDHLSTRLHGQVGEDAAAISALSDDQRAYYVTRFFEREYGSGGITGYVDWGAGLAPLVADGYLRLGLPEAAEAFDMLRESETFQRLLEDETYEPTEAEEAVLDTLAEAVGDHDEERIAYVRRHAEAFSI